MYLTMGAKCPNRRGAEGAEKSSGGSDSLPPPSVCNEDFPICNLQSAISFALSGGVRLCYNGPPVGSSQGA